MARFAVINQAGKITDIAPFPDYFQVIPDGSKVIEVSPEQDCGDTFDGSEWTKAPISYTKL